MKKIQKNKNQKALRAASPESRRTTNADARRFSNGVRRMASEYGDVLRIGQMIINATIAKGDLYYLENAELLAAIEADLAGTSSAVAARSAPEKSLP